MNLHDTVVQRDNSIAEVRLAKPRACRDAVDSVPANDQRSLHGIKIAIAPAPEVDMAKLRRGRHGAGLARLQSAGSAAHLAGKMSIVVAHTDAILERALRGRFISDLRFGMYDRGTASNIELIRPNINPCRPQARIKRKCLVKRSRQMQAHAFVDASVIRVEILVVPLERYSSGLFFVFPIIVHTHGDDIHFWRGPRKCGGVYPEGHDAVLAAPCEYSIYEDLRRLAHAFKLKKGSSAREPFGQHEVLAIPNDACR